MFDNSLRDPEVVQACLEDPSLPLHALVALEAEQEWSRERQDSVRRTDDELQRRQNGEALAAQEATIERGYAELFRREQELRWEREAFRREKEVWAGEQASEERAVEVLRQDVEMREKLVEEAMKLLSGEEREEFERKMSAKAKKAKVLATFGSFTTKERKG